MSLTPKQAHFLEAMLSSQTIEKAIEKSGISRATAFKYLKDDEFKETLREHQKQLMQNTTTRLQSLTSLALDKLEEYMNDPQTSAHSMNMLINTVLQYAYKGYELQEIEERVNEIEKHINK